MLEDSGYPFQKPLNTIGYDSLIFAFFTVFGARPERLMSRCWTCLDLLRSSMTILHVLQLAEYIKDYQIGLGWILAWGIWAMATCGSQCGASFFWQDWRYWRRWPKVIQSQLWDRDTVKIGWPGSCAVQGTSLTSSPCLLRYHCNRAEGMEDRSVVGFPSRVKGITAKICAKNAWKRYKE